MGTQNLSPISYASYEVAKNPRHVATTHRLIIQI